MENKKDNPKEKVHTLYETEKDGLEVTIIDILKENDFFRALEVRSRGNSRGFLTMKTIRNNSGLVQPIIVDALVIRGDASYSGGMNSVVEFMNTYWERVKSVVPQKERRKWLPNLDTCLIVEKQMPKNGLYLG